MIAIIAITITAGAVLLAALYTERVPPPVRRDARRWTGLPHAHDVRRQDFPISLAGYDQGEVDAHLDAVARAVAMMRARLAELEGALRADDPVPVEGVAPAEDVARDEHIARGSARAPGKSGSTGATAGSPAGTPMAAAESDGSVGSTPDE